MTISGIRGLKYFGLSVARRQVVARLNINVNTEDPIVTAGSMIEPNTFYSHTLDDAASIPSVVVQLAGVGKLGF
jgi:pectate lyase